MWPGKVPCQGRGACRSSVAFRCTKVPHGGATRDFRRVPLGTRMPAEPGTTAGVVNAERQRGGR